MARNKLGSTIAGLGLLLVFLVALGVFSLHTSRGEAELNRVQQTVEGVLLDWYAFRAEAGGPNAQRFWESCRAGMEAVLDSTVWSSLITMKRFPMADWEDLRFRWTGLDPSHEVEGRAFENALTRALAHLEEFSTRQREVDGLYREILWAAAAAVLFLAASMAVFQARLRAVNSQLRDLHRSSLVALEQERKSLSRELHDTVAQELAAVKILLSQLPLDPGIGHPIRANLDKALDQVRSLAGGLRPPSLDRIGFAEALRELCQQARQLSEISVVCEVGESMPVLGEDLALHLYRIAQEALLNAVRHSGGSLVKVSTSVSDGTLVLEITDDGRGLSRAGGEGKRSGLGLVGMHERAQLVGARLFVQASQAGTRVHLEVKLDHSRR